MIWRQYGALSRSLLASRTATQYTKALVRPRQAKAVEHRVAPRLRSSRRFVLRPCPKREIGRRKNTKNNCELRPLSFVYSLSRSFIPSLVHLHRARSTMTSIDKLSIQGIRSFSPTQSATIEFFKPLTIIVGEYGAGKTVRALALPFILPNHCLRICRP